MIKPLELSNHHMNNPKLVSVSRIRQIISLIDLTNLNDNCDSAAIETLCQQAKTPVGNVAALCVWPSFVHQSKTLLGPDSSIKIATVVNFPAGTESINASCEAIDDALEQGADEIDYVMPYTDLLNNNTDVVSKSLAAVRKRVPQSKILKVILETGELGSNDLIRTASEIAIDQGANFIKTSTGKVPVNATANAASIMLRAISQSTRDLGFKAAGGIKTISDASSYLDLADELLGRAWVNAEHFRFGASGLLQNALAKLDLTSSTDEDSHY